MHLDVQDLRDFYRGPLGLAAQRVLRDALTGLWPEAKGLTVAGYGFAGPLLRPFLHDARRVMALMPGPQGVAAWPAGGPNMALLVEETLWPLATGFVDRLVVLHGLEATEHPAALLDECWRVLGPGGRAVFMVPNRAGLWARVEATPFGFGRPYSMGQLETLLRRHRFVTERAMSTLYQPPSTRRFWRRAGTMMERAGQHIPLLAAGGVLVVEASKQVSQPTRGAREAARRPAAGAVPVLDGLPQPAGRMPGGRSRGAAGGFSPGWPVAGAPTLC